MPLVPIVIERNGREERAMDIYSRLLQDRIIILGTAIDDQVANVVVAQLLVLAQQDSKADIHLYINSPGGSVTSGMAIYDNGMQFVESGRSWEESFWVEPHQQPDRSNAL